jgi:anti-anti-sigma factor
VELTRRSEFNHVVVAVSGAIDTSTAPGLREHLLRLLNTEPPDLVLDISDVNRVAPPALAMLGEVHRAARLVGGDLTLVCPERGIGNLEGPEVVVPMIPRYESVEQALARRGVPERATEAAG